MEKRWVLKSQPEAEQVKSLAKALGTNDTLTSILCQRGICTFEEAHDFFRPSLEHLHDPFLMAGMDLAVNRLNEALHRNEKDTHLWRL